MYNLIVVSHGDLAEQIVNTSEMILGKQEGIESLCLQPGETKENFENRLEEKLNEFKGGDVLVLADLFGGTPFNSTMTHMLKGEHKINMLTGVNLPMVLHALMNKDNDVNEVVEEIKGVGTEGIQDANEMLKNAVAE